MTYCITGKGYCQCQPDEGDYCPHSKAVADLQSELTAARDEAERLWGRVSELEGQRIIYGAGICDSNYPITREEVVDGKKKQVWACPFYRTWRNMIARCYRERGHERRPGYAECTVCEEWLRFSAFKAWMERQDWESKQMDKDLLVPGNKVYSPENCVFVTQQLNSFVLDRSAARGKYPLGVTWQKTAKKYKAQCKNPFTHQTEAVGYFDDPDSAHEAWRKRKHELACQYAETVSDERLATALRSRYAQRLRQKADELENNNG